MKILLTGATGGIGSAIKDALKGNDFEDGPYIDWIIFAQGILDEQRINDTFDANVMNPIFMTQKYLPSIRQGIIYISSTAGIGGNSKFPIYAASKAALNIYAKSMAKKNHGLQFYALCPGPTDTKMWRSLGLEGKAQDPKEVAKAVIDIINGDYKSGDIIIVRDGYSSVEI